MKSTLTLICQILTFRLLHKDSPSAFWRMILYSGLLLSSSAAMNLASNQHWTPTTADCVIVLMTGMVHWVMLALIYDAGLRYKNWCVKRAGEVISKCEEACSKHIKEAQDDAEQFRLGAIEAVKSHALALKRKLDEHNRKIDGEGWKKGEGDES